MYQAGDWRSLCSRALLSFHLAVLLSNSHLSFSREQRSCHQLPISSGDGLQVQCSVSRLSEISLQPSTDGSVRRLSVHCLPDSTATTTAPVSRRPLDVSSLLQFSSSVRTLTLNGCQFDHIAETTWRQFEALRKLHIQASSTAWTSAPLSLQPASFDGLQRLVSLELSGTGLQSLGDNLFESLRSLKTLNLTNNRLRNFSQLASLTADLPLTTFDVSRNEYVNIPSSVLSQHIKLRQLFLKQNNLLEIEELGLRNLPDLEVIDLSENKLNTLPAMMLSDSKKIREVHLQSNNISLVPPGLFSELTSLVSINISHNQLTSQWIKRDTFQDLSQLIVLDLSYNHLEIVSEGMFDDLSRLQVLQLSHNQLQTLPSGVFAQLRNLHTLSLAGNRFSMVHARLFDGLHVLNRLILSENNIEGIHVDGFENLANLEELRLDDNRLRVYPEAVMNLTQLRHLDLADNRIDHITGAHMHTLRQLSLLRLAGNRLEEITSDLAPIFQRLTMLDLSRNRIERIQSGSFGLSSNLRAIRLDSNKLKAVNGMFNNMTSLLWLNASENVIEFFDYALFPSQLLWLDLHKNNIKSIGNFYSIHDKIRLETLDLSFNDIKTLDASSVPDSIKYFILSSNRLNHVQSGTLRNKSQLVRFDLSSNELSELSIQAITLNGSMADADDAFKQQRGIVTSPQSPQTRAHILLAGNPFVCDCSMDWLISINSMTPARKYPELLDSDQVMCRFRGGGAGDISSGGEKQQPVHLSRARPSDFLCTYDRHCFALCHCCNYVACDCEMRCPDGCTCHHDHTWNTNVVDCRRRQLSRVSRAIPMDTTRLLVDGNSIPRLESHTFIGRQRLRLLQANGSAVQEIQNRSLSGLSALRVLRLQDNLLERLRGDEFDGLLALEELYLHNNKLIHIHAQAFAQLRSLKVLTLHDNRLVTFEMWHLSANSYLVDLSIAGNPWSCDCRFLRDMTRYVRENRAKIEDNRQLQCSYDAEPPACGNGDDVLVDGDTHETMPHHRHADNTLSIVLISVGVVAVVAMLVAYTTYRCRSRFCSRQRLLHPTKSAASRQIHASCCNKMPSNLDATVLSSGLGGQCDDRAQVYDVFVTYSAQDTHFVNDMMTPTLETMAPSLRLCLLRRDAPPANYLGDAVRHCVCASAKTLLVVSRNFLDSEWCRFDFKASHVDALRAARVGVVAVLYGVSRCDIEDDDLRQLLKGAAFVTFGERDFWRKLRSVLPPGRPPATPRPPPPPQQQQQQRGSMPGSASSHSYMSRVLYPSTSTTTTVAESAAEESPSPTCSTVVSEDRCPAMAGQHFRSLSHPQRLRHCGAGGGYSRTCSGLPSVSASMSEPSEHVYMTIDQYRTPPLPLSHQSRQDHHHQHYPHYPGQLQPGHAGDRACGGVYSTLEPDVMSTYSTQQRPPIVSGGSGSERLSSRQIRRPPLVNTDAANSEHRQSPSQSLWV